MREGIKEWHAKADFDLKGNILLLFKTANFTQYQKQRSMLPLIFHPVLIEANLLAQMLIFRYLELPVLTGSTFLKKMFVFRRTVLEGSSSLAFPPQHLLLTLYHKSIFLPCLSLLGFAV